MAIVIVWSGKLPADTTRKVIITLLLPGRRELCAAQGVEPSPLRRDQAIMGRAMNGTFNNGSGTSRDGNEVPVAKIPEK